jgi:sugar-specific transcriptional regulator TrmB
VVAGMLEPLGVSREAESVYLALLDRPRGTASELEVELGLSRRTVAAALRALETLGLATRAADGHPSYAAVAPDAGIEALISRRQDELRRVSVLSSELAQRFRVSRSSRPDDVIEILDGEAALQTFLRLERHVVQEVLILSTPPYEAPTRANVEELDALHRGVVVRAVYDHAALATPGRTLHELEPYIAAGEEARIVSANPIKLAIFDRELALIPLFQRPASLRQSLAVRESALLDNLLWTFETVWAQAVPYGPDAAIDTTSPVAHDVALLALLATGAKDKAIAHHLGIAHRTVTRRIAALLAELDAESRFQAGVTVAKRGWL